MQAHLWVNLAAKCNEGWRRKGTSVERCLRNALKAAAPVGSTSAWAEVTASGAGRLCAEQNFVHSAALGCRKMPSGASKSEIPDQHDTGNEMLRYWPVSKQLTKIDFIPLNAGQDFCR